MSAVIDLPELALQASDAIESGDPEFIQRFGRDFGMSPRVFLSQYAVGADQALAELVTQMRERCKRYDQDGDRAIALRAGAITVDEFATSAGISEQTFDRLQAQVIARVRSSVPYTALMDEMRSALFDRIEDLQSKSGGLPSHESRRASSLAAARNDLDAIAQAEIGWTRPALSEWLDKRYNDERWAMIPMGKYAQEAVQTKMRELMARGLTALVEQSQMPTKTSITEALTECGFARVRENSGLQVGQHPTFMRDGLRLAMRRGGLQAMDGGHLTPTNDPGCVTLEALYTERDASRIVDMRAALMVVIQAADDIGMRLCVNPFPIDLGDDKKALAGASLLALYAGLGFESEGQSPVMTRIPQPAETLSKLLGSAPVPCSDQELEEIAAAYKLALQGQEDDGWKMHHLFDEPEQVVRLESHARQYVQSNGYMTPTQAGQTVEGWRQSALAQGHTGANSEKVVISLFDKTGAWSQPWRDAGYQVYQFDIQSGDGVETFGINMGDVTNFDTQFFNDFFGSFDGLDVHCLLAATPCTDFASSGSRHFAAKDATGTTAFSVALGRIALATIEYFKPAVWAMENPTGRIERLVGLPQWAASFDPWHFGEDYTKKTMLWGRMNGNMPIAPTEPVAGTKMHTQYGGKSIETKNARSVTPEGFAYAFFMANNALDHPALAVHGKYDRLEKALIERALGAGVSPTEIDSLVEDAYFFDLDDAAATIALEGAIAKTQNARADELSKLEM